MNLVDGRILETKDCDAVLDSLNERILETLGKPRLLPETVINACDRLVRTLDESLYLSAMAGLGIPTELGKSYIAEAKVMFSEASLRFRVEREFGSGWNEPYTYVSTPGNATVNEQILPLGVLLHVAAGNADGLPAFSVLEGLLTGNINILKLPAAEGGVSVALLSELIRIEPSLSEYIYVFDYSSKDIVHLGKLIDAADAVVVWGGVEAVSAFRGMLSPNIRLIEWGHKISFAYVTPGGMTDGAPAGIAKNIAATGQLLCSSCQGIFVDTEDLDEVYAFCCRFLPFLENAVSQNTQGLDIGVRAQAALQLYSAELETIYTGHRIFKGNACSLTACNKKTLEPAIGFGNAWVKPLPRNELLKAIRPYKNYLQTAALLCSEDEKEELTEQLLKSGVVRVCSGERMSAAYSGMPHDGEYPLRRYTKVATVE